MHSSIFSFKITILISPLPLKERVGVTLTPAFFIYGVLPSVIIQISSKTSPFHFGVFLISNLSAISGILSFDHEIRKTSSFELLISFTSFFNFITSI